MHQVRSPAPLPPHTRSPQPGQSPRQQAVASPAVMQQPGDPNAPPGAMGGMIQPGTPGAPPHSYGQQMPPNMPPQQQDFNDQGYGGIQPGVGAPGLPENSTLTPQKELSKFVDSL